MLQISAPRMLLDNVLARGMWKACYAPHAWIHFMISKTQTRMGAKVRLGPCMLLALACVASVFHAKPKSTAELFAFFASARIGGNELSPSSPNPIRSCPNFLWYLVVLRQFSHGQKLKKTLHCHSLCANMLAVSAVKTTCSKMVLSSCFFACFSLRL